MSIKITNIFTGLVFYANIKLSNKEKKMLNILNWFKGLNKSDPTYVKPQKFVDLKRHQSTVEFITHGHPLYDNTVTAEENETCLLAPNEAAYSENSLTHNFVAIVVYNDLNYLVINSFKHFKEQSIGGLLQYDENIYTVIPFFEDDEEYQTANSFTFSETYEYDHPVESYAFMAAHNDQNIKITLDRGKQPLSVKMIDEKRPLFTEKLTPEFIELIDYTIIPAIEAFDNLQEKHNNKAS